MQDSSPDRLVCQKCGSPGLLRHAPPPQPVSGVWCEKCFSVLHRRFNLFHTLYRWRLLLFFVVVGLLAWAQQSKAHAPIQTSLVELGEPPSLPPEAIPTLLPATFAQNGGPFNPPTTSDQWPRGSAFITNVRRCAGWY